MRIYQYLSSSLIAFSDKFDAFGNGNILIPKSHVGFRKFYFHFLSRPSLQHRNRAFYKLNSLHKFFIYLKLGVTWSHFPIQNEMKLLPWQTNCLHSANKEPLNLLCESFFPPITEIFWSHNNNPFQKINQLLEPLKYILRFILSKI